MSGSVWRSRIDLLFQEDTPKQGEMITIPSQEDLRQMASGWLAPSQDSRLLRIHTDTTDFFKIEYGDILVLNSTLYLIRHNAKEGRFGLEDEIKFWVKRAIDLKTGDLKIIKLVFYETFKSKVGGIEFEFYRSDKKEARILDLVGDHKNFMHGHSTEDKDGNSIRVIDYIYGKSLHAYIGSLRIDHDTYFEDLFPAILDNYMECIEAIRYLHQNAEKHGDIRRDHILIDRDNGRYRWIDFDINYRHRENVYGYDLFGLGNILLFLVGMGDVVLSDLREQDHPALAALREEDVNIVLNNRVANLKKIYPYIPEVLNRVLLHFSMGANWFYENTTQLLDDLGEFQSSQSSI